MVTIIDEEGEESLSLSVAFAASWIALAMTAVFFLLVAIQILPRFSFLFIAKRAWSHRLAGCFHLCWLLLGAFSCFVSIRSLNNDSDSNNHLAKSTSTLGSSSWSAPWAESKDFVFWYDVLLGCSGVVLTLTAANDFPHKHVRNVPGQSGTLHREAIVTQSEMIEHSFYQCLNLFQSVYLHTLHRLLPGENTTNYRHRIFPPMLLARIFCLWLVTAPWLVRHRFPVHSFSQNWLKQNHSTSKVGTTEAKPRNKIWNSRGNSNKSGDDGERGEVALYRIKKTQYLFYKHVVLHGLNISMALASNNNSTTNHSYHHTQINAQSDILCNIPYGIEWRVFWLLLNTSYVMEFFLQTMVKRGASTQPRMLFLQRWLMAAASLSAANVLWLPNADWAGALRFGSICLFSFALNLAHRHHDVTNTLCIALGCLLWDGVRA